MEWRPEFITPLLAALAAGSLIGYEREFRARAAGFRTHALVAVASALLMLAAQHQIEWAGVAMTDAVMRIDPVRMAHGILTGIGFLCGGVIFKEGLSVHGLTTAASLWVTSALGTLFGVGMYDLAIAGTAVTLVVLVAFRLLDKVMPQQALSDVSVRYRREDAPSEAELCRAVAAKTLKATRVAHKTSDDGALVIYDLTLTSRGPLGADDLVTHLSAGGKLVAYDIEPRNR
jgi:putative Mg2+ transporter-C (MgtC) family protein